jgi:hypothetical protein
MLHYFNLKMIEKLHIRNNDIGSVGTQHLVSTYGIRNLIKLNIS